MYLKEIFLVNITSPHSSFFHTGLQRPFEHLSILRGFSCLHFRSFTVLLTGNLLHVTFRVLIPKEQVFEHALHEPVTQTNL